MLWSRSSLFKAMTSRISPSNRVYRSAIMKLTSLSLPGLLLFFVILRFHGYTSATNVRDLAALQALQKAWGITHLSWSGDPCEPSWLGITCESSSGNVIKLRLPNQSLRGFLPPQISELANLQTLDLSYNGNLTGTLPLELFQLGNLKELFLQNCGLFGEIPDGLGRLVKLKYLALNQNFFIGTIPITIGQLSKLYWLDLSNNQLSGNLPLELSNLTKAGHFHLQANQLSGTIPNGIFNATTSLVHLLLHKNLFEGPIPSDIGNLRRLDILRMDFNRFTSVPESLSDLVTVTTLQIDHNSLTGDVVNVSRVMGLQLLSMGHNQFTKAPLPSWLLLLENLTTLFLENGSLLGSIDASLFALQNLEIVKLGYNELNGTLDLSQAGPNLMEVNVQQNKIAGLKLKGHEHQQHIFSGLLNLQENEICLDNTSQPLNACSGGEQISNESPRSSSSCVCHNGLSSNPTVGSSNCLCSYPISGFIMFTANKVSLEALNLSLLQTDIASSIQVFIKSLDQVSFVVINGSTAYMSIYPYKEEYWNKDDANIITYIISNKSVEFPSVGPFFYEPDTICVFLVPKEKLSLGVKIAISVSAVVSCLLIMIVAVYAFKQRRRAEKAEMISKPFASWERQEGSGPAPKLKGARLFSLTEMKKVTNNFSPAQELGSGSYGKVYKATLPSGEKVAIKKSHASSQQGAAEFRNEIELLSRVHHKNLVELLGFCFEERMLVYEYLPNGTLRDALSGRTMINMDWPRRLQAALDSARGLAYLHAEANPPIIHRDVKSSNILLNEKLVAKVADFGLSKLAAVEGGDGLVSTQVKGTLGYLDPEYYTTQRLSDKSDVYSFGVVILELITSRQPIEHGQFIVPEVRGALRRGGLPALRESLLDMKIQQSCSDSQLKALLKLAFHCLEESAASRPSMKQVTKELEAILDEFEGQSESRGEYGHGHIAMDKDRECGVLVYDRSSFEYSGIYGTSITLEPK